MKAMNPEMFDQNMIAYPFKNEDVPEFIIVDDDSVKFVGQRGPIKEVGVNGCQIDQMIEFARRTLEVFNKMYPCRETSVAITKLQEAEMWCRERTRDRETRGVEGTSTK